MSLVPITDILQSVRSGYWGKDAGSSEADVRVIRNGDVLDSGEIRWSKLPVRSLRKIEIDKSRLSKNDIILTASGDCGYVAYIESEPMSATCATNFVRVVRFDTKRVEPRYIFHFMNRPQFRISLAPFIRGTTMKNLSVVDAFTHVHVPLPSLDEQRRIATVLDTAERLRTKRRTVVAKFDSLILSIFLDLFGNPIHNERGWQLARLEDIAQVDRGKFTPRPRNDPSYYGGDFPFIQTGDISGSGGRLRSWTQTLNSRGTAVSRSFPVGTVVIAIVGATLGITAILDIEVYCPDSVVGIQPDRNRATAEYIERILRFWRPIFVAQAPETARANINLETLRPLRIPVPPISLQRDFSRQVAAIEQLTELHRDSIGRLEVLSSTLQRQAFLGL